LNQRSWSGPRGARAWGLGRSARNPKALVSPLPGRGPRPPAGNCGKSVFFFILCRSRPMLPRAPPDPPGHNKVFSGPPFIEWLRFTTFRFSKNIRWSSAPEPSQGRGDSGALRETTRRRPFQTPGEGRRPRARSRFSPRTEKKVVQEERGAKKDTSFFFGFKL
jgi:hypothetical protein